MRNKLKIEKKNASEMQTQFLVKLKKGRVQFCNQLVFDRLFLPQNMKILKLYK